MYTNSWAGDMAIGGAMHRAADAELQTHEWFKAYGECKAELDETELANAANLSVRYALVEQLKRHDPANPLLTDKSLLERLMSAAKSAFSVAERAKCFDAARDVGRTFKIPGREGPLRVIPPSIPVVPKPSTAQDETNPQFMRDQYSGSLALREALAAALRKVDPDHPLLKDTMLTERVRKAGIFACRMAGGHYQAARDTGREFDIPGRE